MSRGPGRIQTAVEAALLAEPRRMFTVEDLARCAYPGKVIEHKHLTAVRRALDGIPGLGTDGPRSNQHLKAHPTGRGWHRVVRVVAL
jgi:hypothetical protein